MSRAGWKRLLQLVALVALGALVSIALRTQWTALGSAARSVRPRALPLVASCMAVLAVYGVQIHAWRTLVSAWGKRLPFLEAARIWSVSNLARYTPGQAVASTGALALLGRRAGVPPAAAAGAAVLGTLLNLVAGFVVVAVLGARLLPALSSRVAPWMVPVIGVAAAAVLVALPLLVRPLATAVSRVVRRPVTLPPMPLGVLATAVTANLVAWLLYGLAFRSLALSLLPDVPTGWLAFTAIYAAGYLAGLLAVVTPAGLGVRETALVLALGQLGTVTTADAWLLVLASRLSLTVLEVLPGAAFLAYGASRRTP